MAQTSLNSLIISPDPRFVGVHTKLAASISLPAVSCTTLYDALWLGRDSAYAVIDLQGAEMPGMSQIEQEAVKSALKRADGSPLNAARMLGRSRDWVYNHKAIDKYPRSSS